MAYQSKNPKFDSLILKDNAAGSVDAPASGSTKVINRGGQLFEVDSSGAETLLADGGGSGEINYILNYGFEDGNITGWSTYDDGASATPVDGTGGSPSTLTLTLNDTTPIRGLYDLQVAKSAADSQGEGFSYDFTIDEIDSNKLLKIQFDMDTTDANYTAGDLVAYVYDVDNTTLITPSSVSIPSALDTFAVSFVSSDATNYRLIFHWAVTTASAAELHFDEFIVGPGRITQSTANARWLATDVTLASTGTSPTYSTSTHYSRRNGSNLELQGYFTGFSAAGSGNYQIVVPNNLTIDSTGTAVGSDVLGFGIAQDGTNRFGVQFGTTGTTRLTIVLADTRSSLSSSTVTWTSSGYMAYHVSIPIAEWAGNSTYAETNEIEYAYNSSTADSTDTSSFAYGPAGVSFGSYTAARQKRVQFQKPIQPTDHIVLEVNYLGYWLPLSSNTTVGSGVTPYQEQNGTTYGMTIVQVGSQTVDVYFGTYRNPASTFGAAGNAWSGIAASRKWRLKKFSGGTPVGFGLAAENKAGLVSSTTQDFSGIKSFLGAASANSNISTFDLPIGTTDGNYGQIVLRDSSNSNSTRASLGMRYEDTATAGAAGYLGLNSRSGTGYYLWVDTSSNLEISATFANVGGTGTGTVVGSQTSDERLKSQIKDLDLGLDAVLKLKPIRYQMYGKEEIGFGAQTTEKVVPEAVYTSREPLYPNEQREDDPRDRKGMEYVRIIPVLVNAIKELKAEIELLKKER